MARKLSYSDAVKLLGAKEHPIVAALDRIVGGALLGGVALGVNELLGWFDAKVDFIRLSHELLVKAAEKRSGLSRYSRTERLHAAHAVMVVVAFFEAAKEIPFDLKHLEITRADQGELLGMHGLFDGDLPLPTADQPLEIALVSLNHRYMVAAHDLLSTVGASAAWDRLNETEQARLSVAVMRIPQVAVDKYRDMLLQSAADYPEIRFWFQVEDAKATRAALERLESDLAILRVGRDPDARRADLARRYRAVLDRPIVDAHDAPPGLRIPTLREAYIDPCFQVAVGVGEPSVAALWAQIPVRQDLYRFLIGHLTSLVATSEPLVVLGDPGAGKSMLTKVLAARLPASDFLTVRVELRSTPAEADLLEQIEHGLRAAVQENLGWAELGRAAGDALPVVLLDGLDELLQATGVSQSRYLLRIAQFQQDRADAGYPVAVVVTSRISVMGGISVPLEAPVLRLVPFTDEQVAQWLEVWDRTNAGYFGARGPLEAEIVLRYKELATQPLLLLMLALYDAVDDGLRQERSALSEAELYERILTGFARREVEKADADRSEADRDEDVEAELERLSVVAFAMFNRGTQWVSEVDVTADFAALLDVEPSGRPTGARTPLSPGEAALGRFFFVQRAEAVRDQKTLRTYEFLHATFGEYLVARFTWRVLGDVRRAEEARPRRAAAVPVDDSDLYALLSFTPLTSRGPVLGFLAGMADGDEDREALSGVVQRLFEGMSRPHVRGRGDYAPVERTVPAREAVYGLNLVLLYGIARGPFDVRDLGVRDWPRLTAFWKSQLPDGEWRTLVESVPVRWVEGPSVELFGWSLPVTDPLPAVVADQAAALRDETWELHFTADPVGNAFRFPVQHLAETTSVHRLRAIVDLALPSPTAAVREVRHLRWAPVEPLVVRHQFRTPPPLGPETLRVLASGPIGREAAFWARVCEAIGRGGPDRELVALVGEHWDSAAVPNLAAVAVVDAWLRLHESGFEFGPEWGVARVLAEVDVETVAALRPDLGKRIGHAMRELGLDADAVWPHDRVRTAQPATRPPGSRR
ncbi:MULTISPECIES: NACHT domain-containing protein [unclassified Saccharothrix]|uniref:NACHT domain-containing protein n=1 Tax=unclassified Saccharothrix TaxID=2593673 RepID=UPI00307E147B